MRKVNFLFVTLYLIGGALLGWSFFILVSFTFAFPRAFVSVLSFGQYSYKENNLLDIFTLFIGVVIFLTPVTLYLSRYYNRVKIVLSALVLAIVITLFVYIYSVYKNNNAIVEEVKKIPATQITS